ncbi:MAG: hypothetical protein ABIV47_25625 [Roseiflexaceae bacterium]
MGAVEQVYGWQRRSAACGPRARNCGYEWYALFQILKERKRGRFRLDAKLGLEDAATVLELGERRATLTTFKSQAQQELACNPSFLERAMGLCCFGKRQNIGNMCLDLPSSNCLKHDTGAPKQICPLSFCG